MNIILLSGGSGKRLWPLSNDIRSKQFIKIFLNEQGEYESMLQRMYKGIRQVDPEANITIATSRSQVSAIHNQIGQDVDVSVEPCRRDTFPAIALAANYLKEFQGVGEDDPVVVCPVDPYVTRDYFEALKVLSDATATGEYRLNLMGMEPTYPSEKYGYVSPALAGGTGASVLQKVSGFKEKPDVETAKKYIEQGALWNGGIFAFKLGYVLKRSHELIDYKDYRDFFDRYDQFEKISFDYAVSEREDSIGVLRFAGVWKDLGTWNTLTEAMEYPVIGNGILNDKCENTHVINSLDVPVLCMGLKNVVVAASPEGVLVSDKGESSYIKPFVDKFDQQIMFAEKSWGNYLVIDATADSLTVKVTLHKGSKMNYHSHERRDESWNIISGTGRVIVDGVERTVTAGDIVSLPVGCKHTIIAETELQVIEVQFGKDIDVHDKIKHEL